jgi:hypothetical protein
MEEAENKPIVHRPHMPCRLDQEVQIEMVDHLCGFMASHGVVPTLAIDIL